MNIQKYYDALKNHDWHYAMSDDHRVFKAGEEARADLRKLAELSPEHKKLYDDWKAHVFSGRPWGTEKKPRPERP